MGRAVLGWFFADLKRLLRGAAIHAVDLNTLHHDWDGDTNNDAKAVRNSSLVRRFAVRSQASPGFVEVHGCSKVAIAIVKADSYSTGNVVDGITLSEHWPVRYDTALNTKLERETSVPLCLVSVP